MSTVYLSGADEENCLIALCYSAENAATIASRVTADLFATRSYRHIASAALKYVERYHEPPKRHIYDLLEERLDQGKEGANLLRILEGMEEIAPKINEEFVIDNLDLFIEKQRLRRAYQAGLEALEKDDIETARAVTQDVVRIPADQPGIWLHKPDEALRFLNKKEEDFFSSGVPTLDEMGVVPKRKTMFLIVAPAKAGKSFWLVEIGKHAIFHRKNVLHITLEMSSDETAMRYVQALEGLRRDDNENVKVSSFTDDKYVPLDETDIKRPGVNDANRATIEQKLRTVGRRSRFYIKEFPTSMLSVAQLTAFLDRMEAQDKFKPDMLILDYGDLMSLDTGNLRIDTGAVFRQLRGIAVQRNMALVTATQGNRLSAHAKLVRGDMVAEDWSKIATADIVCTYSQTQFEREHNIARILVDSSRTTASRASVYISQAYAMGQFCLDSRLHSKDIGEALDEMEHANQPRSNSGFSR